MSHDEQSPLARPRELALLLLANCDSLPRQRARDQQADLAGLTLMRRVLDRLAAIDPESDDEEMALARIIEEIGHPTGPTRAIARMVLEDFRVARASPAWITHLRHQGSRETQEDRRRG